MEINDLNLNNVRNLKWLPFVGENYFYIPKEYRMLVVGESHYNDGTEKGKLDVDDIDWTRDMIQENAIDGVNWNTNIIPNFHKAIFRENDFNKYKFWNSVAFYNFIQRSMDTIKNRPSQEEFKDDWNTFFDLIRVIKPKTCLFIGVSASNHLMSAIEESGFSCDGIVSVAKIGKVSSRSSILKDVENNEIKLVFIQHTSSYFSWKKWNSYLKKEIGTQLAWFEENSDINKKIEKYYGITDFDLIMKLDALDVVIKKELEVFFTDKHVQFEGGRAEYNGEYIGYDLLVNGISFGFEIDLEEEGFDSYPNPIKGSKSEFFKLKFEEYGIRPISYKHDVSLELLSSQIINQIKACVFVLNGDVDVE